METTLPVVALNWKQFAFLITDGRDGEYLFRVEESDGTKTPEQECVEWVDSQDVELYKQVAEEIPCPSNLFSLAVEYQLVEYYILSILCR